MDVVVNQNVLDYLIKHMLDIHDQKMAIVGSYSAEYDVYMKTLFTLNEYINRIEKFLASVKIDDAFCELPFVIFGCNIDLCESGTQQTMICSVILPNDARYGNDDYNGVTLFPCCSAAADALLYKSVGDKVRLENSKKNWTIKKLSI